MKRNLSLPRYAIALLCAYGIQFLAGMSINLFVKIPKYHPGADSKNFITGTGHGFIWALSGHGGNFLSFHAFLAILLFFGSLGLFVRSIRLKNKLWAWIGAIAAFFTLGAIINGLSFVNYNHAANSMVMASCWLVAVGSLIYGLISSQQPSVSQAKTKPRVA